MKKKIISCVMATALTVSAFAACSGSEGGGDETTVEVTTRQAAQTDASGNQSYSEDEVLEMTMFACMSGTEINDGNEIQELIAERTGVKVKETWLTGQTASEAIGSIIASGDLPDFIDGGDGCVQLYENGLLVAWDPFLEEYPNLKEMYSDDNTASHLNAENVQNAVDEVYSKNWKGISCRQ